VALPFADVKSIKAMERLDSPGAVAQTGEVIGTAALSALAIAGIAGVVMLAVALAGG
jgi:hypothetical protein